MDKQKIPPEIIKIIFQGRKDGKSFKNIVEDFEKKLLDFNPIENNFKIDEYFGKGIGKSTSMKLLMEDKIVKKEWLREYKTKKGNTKIDFKGLYVFIHNNKPFYVGISKGVIGRINQHIKGNNHNTSTLAYKIGLLKYEFENEKKFKGKRKDLNFVNNVEPIKAFLKKQNIAFLPIENDEELVLFEIYCSIKLNTWLNTFETH